jgi:hypothetical protein
MIACTLALAAASPLVAQTDTTRKVYTCVVCGKPILTQAAYIDGKFYHPECFRCAFCGKQIAGDYVRGEDGKYYHPKCCPDARHEICAYCNRAITDAHFTSYKGKFYHNKCYLDFVAPRCDICGEPLDGEVITDFWGNRFHARHAREFPVCVVCGRLVVRDGIEIEPGRWMCPICATTSVQTPERGREILERVRDKLAGVGIVVTTLGLRIELVNFDILNQDKQTGRTAHTYAGIFWNSGGGDYGDETATIKVLKGLPEDLMSGVLAHELMHIWQHENGVDRASLELREGSANWASSLIYSQLGNERGRYFLGGLEKSTDPIYGEGYRTVAQYADNKGVNGVLQMLKQEGASGEAQKKR